ncbi:MAG: sigma-70 family RNA polymerase sigma factor [Clostridia bacterium]|nr:sigma-70 family RNA polymerase sigma factor [Clostridia bacterium]
MCEKERRVGRRRLDEAASRLSEYQMYRKMLAVANALNAEDETEHNRAVDCVMLRMKMRDIERSLRALPPCDARMLLELHYLGGMSIEHCAEQLYVSRATAYRLKNRGLALWAERA